MIFRQLSFLLIGMLFAFGLVIAGMTLPSKVIGFLDVTGQWDPSLALVMAAAVSVHAVSYPLIRRRSSPIWAFAFQVPTVKTIDRRLIIGAILFGIGWGLAGYCPGPALSALTNMDIDTVLFVSAMLVSMLSYSFVTALRARRWT